MAGMHSIGKATLTANFGLMMGPLDLTKQPPRSAREELDGIAYLPRAIDKIRAEFPGGNLGKYVVMGANGATITDRFYRATG